MAEPNPVDTHPNKEIDLYWYQAQALEALDQKIRFCAMIGGTGAGKTWFGPWWLAEVIAQDVRNGWHRGARYLAIAPTVRMAEDILVPTICEAFRGTKLQGEYLAQKNIYRLRTSGTIYFRSADRPERIEGHHVKAVWMDEPGQMKAFIWPIVQARTGFHQAPILLTGYPTSTNWYYQDIYLPWRGGDKDFRVIQFASTDNPAYSAKEMERARKTLPSWLFEMRYLGQFRRPAGLVYPDFTNENNVVESFNPDPNWPLYAGIDPGSFFGVLFVYQHDGNWFVWREFYTEELMGAAERSRRLKEILQGRKPLAWIYDPARLQDVLDLAEHGLGPFYPANNAVMAGIESLTSVVKPGNFKVMRGQASNFMDQMARYSFPVDPATGTRKAENPVKQFDHLPDCARYVIHTLLGAPEESEETVIFNNPTRISPV